MKFTSIASMLLIAGMASSVFAADDSFNLKGNVQTQVTKSIADEDNNFSSGWIRANVGGQYKSESLDGLIMLRIFAPEFGNKNVTDATTDENGKVNTAHTTNPVPCVYVDAAEKDVELREGGRLSDLAPTLLDMLGLPKPVEMTGSTLFAG